MCVFEQKERKTDMVRKRERERERGGGGGLRITISIKTIADSLCT